VEQVEVRDLKLEYDPRPEDTQDVYKSLHPEKDPKKLSEGEPKDQDTRPCSLGTALVTVLGNISVSSCSLLTSGGHAVACGEESNTLIEGTEVGGMGHGPHPPGPDLLGGGMRDGDVEELVSLLEKIRGFADENSEDGRCRNGITLQDDAYLELKTSVVRHCSGGGLTVGCSSSAFCTSTSFSNVGYGICVEDNGKCSASSCTFTISEDPFLDCGAWYAGERCQTLDPRP
jgi:hypothetical protein